MSRNNKGKQFSRQTIVNHQPDVEGLLKDK